MDELYDAIYVKTTAGQRQVVQDYQQLAPELMRLLMLCNGFTPFGHLAERLQLSEPHRARDTLLAMGLIEAVRSRDEPRVPSGWMNLDSLHLDT
jgi:hypothetical protein